MNTKLCIYNRWEEPAPLSWSFASKILCGGDCSHCLYFLIENILNSFDYKFVGCFDSMQFILFSFSADFICWMIIFFLSTIPLIIVMLTHIETFYSLKKVIIFVCIVIVILWVVKAWFKFNNGNLYIDKELLLSGTCDRQIAIAIHRPVCCTCI